MKIWHLSFSLDSFEAISFKDFFESILHSSTRGQGEFHLGLVWLIVWMVRNQYLYIVVFFPEFFLFNLNIFEYTSM